MPSQAQFAEAVAVERIHERSEGQILYWTIDEPARRNPVSPQTLDWISRRAPELSGQVVVLTGAGEEVFCSGFDLRALSSTAPNGLEPNAEGHARDAPLERATAAMLSANATFIALMNGHAIGAGLELICTCDFRFARSGCELALPAGRMGLLYREDALARMYKVLGSNALRRLLLAGERFAVEDQGVSSAFVQVDALAPLTRNCRAFAEQLAELSPAPLGAHRKLLQDFDRGWPRDPVQQQDYEAERRASYQSQAHASALQRWRDTHRPKT